MKSTLKPIGTTTTQSRTTEYYEVFPDEFELSVNQKTVEFIVLDEEGAPIYYRLPRKQVLELLQKFED